MTIVIPSKNTIGAIAFESRKTHLWKELYLSFLFADTVFAFKRRFFVLFFERNDKLMINGCGVTIMFMKHSLCQKGTMQQLNINPVATSGEI